MCAALVVDSVVYIVHLLHLKVPGANRKRRCGGMYRIKRTGNLTQAISPVQDNARGLGEDVQAKREAREAREAKVRVWRGKGIGVGLAVLGRLGRTGRDA